MLPFKREPCSCVSLTRSHSQQSCFIYLLYQSLIQDCCVFFLKQKEWGRERYLKHLGSELFYIHLFNKYLLGVYHVPGTLLIATYTLVNKSDPIPVCVRAPAGNRWPRKG